MFISWFWYLFLGYVNLPTLEIGRRAYVNSLSYSCSFPSVQNYLKIKRVCFKVLNHGPQRIQRQDWVTVMWHARKRATGQHCWPETLNWLCFTVSKGFAHLIYLQPGISKMKITDQHLEWASCLVSPYGCFLQPWNCQDREGPWSKKWKRINTFTVTTEK